MALRLEECRCAGPLYLSPNLGELVCQFAICALTSMVPLCMSYFILQNSTVRFKRKFASSQMVMCSICARKQNMNNDTCTEAKNDSSLSSLVINDYHHVSWSSDSYRDTNIENQLKCSEVQFHAIKKVKICNRPEVIYLSMEEDKEISVLYLKPSKRNSLHVKRKLGTRTAVVGENVTLLAEFRSEILKCLWYKDDIPIENNKYFKLSTINNITGCTINNVNFNDAGFYTAVAKIKHGLTATTGVIFVNKQKQEEVLPKFVEVFHDKNGIEFTDLRLDCKVCPPNVSIQWYREDEEILQSNDVIFEDYGSGYISLLIIKPTKKWSGVFKCKIANNLGIETCSGIVNFTEPEGCDIHPNGTVTVLKKLTDVVAILGSETSLEVQFDVPDPENYHTLWIVGRHRLTTETQNHDLFTEFICKNKFMLKIHKVQLDMAGEIQCQLICSGTCNQFCLATTTSFLTIVPFTLLASHLESIKFCRPIVTMCSKVVNVACGNDIAMRADIESSLSITAVIWYHSDRRIEIEMSDSTSLRYKIENNKNHTTLTIKNATFDDFGDYKIVVENSEGTGTAAAKLIVWTIPDTPTRSPLLEPSLKNDVLTITLTWEPSTEGSWYAVEKNKKGTFIQVLKVFVPEAVFQNVTRGEKHQYRYRVANPVFVGEPSPVIDVCIEYPEPRAEQVNMKLQDIEEYLRTYTAHDVLGSGSFGKVVLVTANSTGSQFAAKIMKTKISKKRTAALREFEILKTLSHDKIIQIFACYSEKNQVIIVTEYLSGGELFERVLQEDCVTEADCVMYMRQVCVGVAYLHSKHIVHLDLKAENIMCVAKNSKQVKIIDLGLAHYINAGSTELRAMYGTRDYVAPEIIKYDPITLKTDMWCIGIITYILLSGLLPFSGETWPERSTNIQRVNYDYDNDVFDYVSPEAKQFIDRLLVMPPERRLSATECLNHPWLTMTRKSGIIYTLERTKRNLRTLLETYRSKWHKAGNVLIAARRLRAPANATAVGNSAAPLLPRASFDPRSSCDWQVSRQT